MRSGQVLTLGSVPVFLLVFFVFQGAICGSNLIRSFFAARCTIRCAWRAAAVPCLLAARPTRCSQPPLRLTQTAPSTSPPAPPPHSPLPSARRRMRCCADRATTAVPTSRCTSSNPAPARSRQQIPSRLQTPAQPLRRRRCVSLLSVRPPVFAFDWIRPSLRSLARLFSVRLSLAVVPHCNSTCSLSLSLPYCRSFCAPPRIALISARLACFQFRCCPLSSAVLLLSPSLCSCLPAPARVHLLHPSLCPPPPLTPLLSACAGAMRLVSLLPPRPSAFVHTQCKSPDPIGTRKLNHCRPC